MYITLISAQSPHGKFGHVHCVAISVTAKTCQ